MKETTIVLKKHLDTKLSSKFAHVAGKFISDIKIESKGMKVDAKSIMGVMILMAKKDSEITLIADGTDAVVALETLKLELNSDL